MKFLLIFVLPEINFGMFFKVLCNKLVIKPTPDESNEISGIFGEAFVISCATDGFDSKNFQWFSPNKTVISSDSNQEIFTLLVGNSLRLFFKQLKITDSGQYTCYMDKKTKIYTYLDVKSNEP